MWIPEKIVKQTCPVSFLMTLKGQVWRRYINQIRKQIANKGSNPTITDDGHIPDFMDFPIESVPYPTIIDTGEPPHIEDSTLKQNVLTLQTTNEGLTIADVLFVIPLNRTFKKGARGNVVTVWTIVIIIIMILIFNSYCLIVY